MYFPKPYPDELLGCVVGRAVRHLGLPFRTVLRKVLLRPDANLSFFLPADLRQLARLTGKSPEALALGHTLFPYCSAYAAPQEAARLLDVIGHGRNAFAPRELLKAAWFSFTRLRFCPECLRADLARCGESYWHRSHFLPTVVDCPIHGCRLLEDLQPWSERRAFRLLPDDLQQAACTAGASHLDVQSALARTSLRTLDPHWQRREDWVEVYRKEAATRGYVQASGEVAATQLARDLESLFGVDFLNSLGCPLGTASQRAWPVLLLRRSVHSGFSPAKHLLLQCFFELMPRPGPAASKKRGPKPADMGEVDGLLAASFQQQWDTVKAAGERLTVRSVLQSLDAWSIVHNKRQALPRTAALIRAFRQSEQWQSGGRMPLQKKRAGSENYP